MRMASRMTVLRSMPTMLSLSRETVIDNAFTTALAKELVCSIWHRSEIPGLGIQSQ